MYKLFYLLLFVCLISACGPQDSSGAKTVETDEIFPSTTPDSLSEEEVLGNIRAFYAITNAELEAGQLEKDSIEYTCEDPRREGMITLYSDAGGIVLAEHSYSMGDHSGQTDHWYFKDDRLVFLLEKSGTWRFGGPMMKDEEGRETPGTVDEITENRYYFNDAELLKQVTKSYTLESGKKEVDPESVPNEEVAHQGEIPESYNFIASVMTTRTVNCGLLE